MNNAVLKYSIRFVALLLVQVLIFNNINFLGYINPYIYVIFILVYPAKNNRLVFLLVAFLLGMLMDMFVDSGGVHAAASVFLAYVRPVFLKFSFGTLYEHQTIKFGAVEFVSLLGYVSLGVVFHHLILFLLEIFNMAQILLILKKTLFSSGLTIILSILFILLFRRRK